MNKMGFESKMERLTKEERLMEIKKYWYRDHPKAKTDELCLHCCEHFLKGAASVNSYPIGVQDSLFLQKGCYGDRKIHLYPAVDVLPICGLAARNNLKTATIVGIPNFFAND